MYQIPLILVVASLPLFRSSTFKHFNLFIRSSWSDISGISFLTCKKYRTFSCENQDPSVPPVTSTLKKKTVKIIFPNFVGISRFYAFYNAISYFPSPEIPIPDLHLPNFLLNLYILLHLYALNQSELILNRRPMDYIHHI